MTLHRVLAVLLLSATLAAQDASQQEQPLPRFRGGATLVHVDAYVTEQGAPLTDLRREDFDVLEDGVSQRVETFSLVVPRTPAEATGVEPDTGSEPSAATADPHAQVFVLFMDLWHVQLAGSYRASNPLAGLLDQVIGKDDLVGVMTPDMSARNLTLARRTAGIEGILRDNWFWGERDRLNMSDPREEALRRCYPDEGDTAGIAAVMIARRREAKTLESLEQLVQHLEEVRQERKFVVVLSDGWRLLKQDQDLGRPLRPAPGANPRVRGRGRAEPPPAPAGGPTVDQEPGLMAYESCDRERAMLAFADHEVDFRRLLQRANRANVSFYPVDARGLVTLDEPLGASRTPSPSDDADGLRARQDALRELAVQTDGVAVLDASAAGPAIARMVADTGAYYLLGYYSTNTKLDGKFRQVSVRVKRPGLDVRTRPGYLAATEAELASERVDALMNGAAPGHSTRPASSARALTNLASSRGNAPLRASAAGGPGYVWLTAELDTATVKRQEWLQGGRALVTIEHEGGDASPVVVDQALEPGQRTLSLVRPEGARLAPGRYVVRVQLTAQGAGASLQTTVDAIVPPEGALMSRSGLLSRRGPTTGLEYQLTADPRFRRTERLRLEIPRFSGEATLSASLQNRAGQTLPLEVALVDKLDSARQLQFVVADLSLAPLAQGEYVLAVEASADGRKESVSFGFRIVP